MKQKPFRRKLQVNIPKGMKHLMEDRNGELCGCAHRRDAHKEILCSRDYKTAFWDTKCQICKCNCPGFETDNLKYLEKLKASRAKPS
jgi:hypothetical protein